MNIRLREVKNTLRDFLEDRKIWPEEKLWVMLRAARENKMRYFDIVCECILDFAGKVADFHEYQYGSSYVRGCRVAGANLAEQAYYSLGHIGSEDGDGRGDDATRNRRLVPIIRSELRRREQIRIKEQQLEMETAAV